MKKYLKLSLFTLFLFAINGCERKSDPQSGSSLKNQRESMDPDLKGREAHTLTHLANLAAVYRDARDRLILGEGGLIAKSTEFKQKFAEWLGAWQGLLDTLDTTSNYEFSTIESLIIKELSKQEEQLVLLESHAKTIEEMTLEIESILERYPYLSFHLGKFQKNYDAIKTTIGRMKEETTGIAIEAKLRVADAKKYSSSIKKNILIKVKAEFMNRNIRDLNAAIQAIDNLFLTEEKINPLVQDISLHYRTINQYFISGRIFRSAKENEIFQARCEESRVLLSDSVIKGKLADDAKRFTTSLCDSANTNINNIIEGDLAFLRSVVYGSLKKRLPNLLSSCNGETKPLYDCAQIKLLATVTSDNLEALTRDELKTIEASIDMAEFGFENLLNRN